MYKGENIKQIIVNVLGSHSNIDQTRVIKTSGFTMKINKTEDLSNGQTFYEGLSKIQLPSFCDLVNNVNCWNNFENITMTVNSYYLNISQYDNDSHLISFNRLYQHQWLLVFIMEIMKLKLVYQIAYIRLKEVPKFLT